MVPRAGGTAAKASEAKSSAILALVESHRRFLAFLEQRTGSRDEAEEILQAAFVKGIERAGEIREEERAVAWFYRLLRNALADRWRERAVERRGEAALARELADAVAPEPQIANQLCHCFAPLLPRLRPQHEDILRRVDLEGMHPVDFARQAGITPNNAMSRSSWPSAARCTSPWSRCTRE